MDGVDSEKVGGICVYMRVNHDHRHPEIQATGVCGFRSCNSWPGGVPLVSPTSSFNDNSQRSATVIFVASHRETATTFDSSTMLTFQEGQKQASR